jgi:excisionase family DNA binding protein
MSMMIQKPVSHTSRIVEFERLLDSEEATSLLKIHPKTLQRMARQKRISGIQIGKLWRFRVSELDRWLKERIAA